MGINSIGGRHICCAKTRGAGFSYCKTTDVVYTIEDVKNKPPKK